jgi:hypothetical protein
MNEIASGFLACGITTSQWTLQSGEPAAHLLDFMRAALSLSRKFEGFLARSSDER